MRSVTILMNCLYQNFNLYQAEFVDKQSNKAEGGHYMLVSLTEFDLDNLYLYFQTRLQSNFVNIIIFLT